MRRRGFTIMELVIYIALLATILSSVIVILYQVIAGEVQGQNRSEVDGEANFIMQKIAYEMSGAATINQPVAGATSAILSVNKYNYAQNPVVFGLSSGAVTISRGGGPAVPLNDSRVTISGLLFYAIPPVNSRSEGVSTTLSAVSLAGGRVVLSSTTIVSTFYLLQ